MNEVLDRVDQASDLQALTMEELACLAGEVRELIIRTVSRTGGHLGANLGVVDLTIALLREFDPLEDRIVWDVSHQAYTHKILTGRKDRFGTLRQADGISGFLRRSESPSDCFGAGHAGTALSAALGMAAAMEMDGTNRKAVAVVGDAAAGCGVSLEALNNIPPTASRLVVILNDNEMSIDANVGAISRYLGRLLANPRYNRWKRFVEGAARRMKMECLRTTYYRLEETIKSLFLRSVMFEELGLRYIGPIDGHNMTELRGAMTIARESDKPILVHVSTRKGKGYHFAEENPERWHGTPGFDIATGCSISSGSSSPGYSAVFGEALVKIAERDPRVVAITAAMTQGTGLHGFSRQFPKRFHDVGIAESHAVVFAAGLATQGKVPVFVVYSTFLQRAVDHVIHDVCLQGLPVVLCLDRAGVVGDDGPTHHGVFDIALLRSVPGLVFMQPRDATMLRDMLWTAVQCDRPVVLRYPRGRCPDGPSSEDFTPLELGKADVLKVGQAVQIWALGDMLPIALDAARVLETRGVSAGVVDPRFICPFDTELLENQASGGTLFVTIENGIAAGGFGSSVREFLGAKGLANEVLCFGWPAEFVPHGSPAVLMERFGLTSEAIAGSIEARVGEQVAGE